MVHEARFGRSSMSHNENNIKLVHYWLNSDRRSSVYQIAETVNMSTINCTPYLLECTLKIEKKGHSYPEQNQRHQETPSRTTRRVTSFFFLTWTGPSPLAFLQSRLGSDRLVFVSSTDRNSERRACGVLCEHSN